MDGTENLTETFLEMHHLMHEYHMAWYRKNFGGIDPKHGQGRILTALSHMDTVSQKELGFIMDMRPQSLGELLQKLESNGYISRHRSPADKRSLIIELTEKGRQFPHSRPDYEE
ncbi:MAG: MarR family transcriptional regulator, partial [Selenomonadaceae bacterium]|nr:MarR family transcriptional regulator [Selenomonadaceae bacterium]